MWSSKKIPTSLEKKNEQGTGVPQNINMIQDFQNHKTGKCVLSWGMFPRCLLESQHPDLSGSVSLNLAIWSHGWAAGRQLLVWYGRGVPCSVYIIGDALIIDILCIVVFIYDIYIYADAYIYIHIQCIKLYTYLFFKMFSLIYALYRRILMSIYLDKGPVPAIHRGVFQENSKNDPTENATYDLFHERLEDFQDVLRRKKTLPNGNISF